MLNYVTLWPWPLTLWLWTFAMYRLSRDQTLDQILAKLNIYRQSYSDLKVDNLGAIRHIGVGRSRFSQFGTLPPGQIKHQPVKFQHSWPMYGWVTDDSTNYHGPVFMTWAILYRLFLRVGDMREIKWWSKSNLGKRCRPMAWTIIIASI